MRSRAFLPRRLGGVDRRARDTARVSLDASAFIARVLDVCEVLFQQKPIFSSTVFMVSFSG